MGRPAGTDYIAHGLPHDLAAHECAHELAHWGKEKHDIMIMVVGSMYMRRKAAKGSIRHACVGS